MEPNKVMKHVTYHTVEKKSNYVDMIPPTDEVWEWVNNSTNGDVHIFEDTLLPDHINFSGKIKVACIMEAPAIYDFCAANNPNMFHPYRWLKSNHTYFDYVMSPFTEIKSMVGDRYLWIPSGGSRIKREDFGMWEKERLLSIVASHKNWTVGHRLRHEIMQRYPGKIEPYGSGYNNIIDNYEGGRLGKVLAVAPYYFSFAVMNSSENDYFTEILTDVLATGTIPLWWGTANIGKYFNPDGIIKFTTLEELDAIMPTLTPELYNSKRSAIQENIEKAREYITRFDWVYKNYKNKFESL
jgi:hypothetical protein